MVAKHRHTRAEISRAGYNERDPRRKKVGWDDRVTRRRFVDSGSRVGAAEKSRARS